MTLVTLAIRGAHLRRLTRPIMAVGAMVVALATLAGCAVGAPSGGPGARVTGAKATPAATPRGVTGRPDFQTGVAYPKWGTRVYGPSDSSWPGRAYAMRQQTDAGWVEMIVSLDQDGVSGTKVYAGSDTVNADALYAGIVTARQAGLRVFIEPLLNVHNAQDSWSGYVTFATHDQAQAWFTSYWAAYKPYVEAAKRAGASQVSIGSEYQTLETEYPDLWVALAHNVKTTFGGSVTYDINHSDLGHTMPTWMRTPDLSAIGVSMYLSPLSAPASGDWSEAQIAQWWQSKALPLLDQLSVQTGKPVVMTEIGYRNASDALYQPWTWKTTAPADPTLQGAAYTAALAAAAGDSHIDGMYFWAWDTGQFTPGPDATAALRAAWG